MNNPIEKIKTRKEIDAIIEQCNNSSIPLALQNRRSDYTVYIDEFPNSFLPLPCSRRGDEKWKKLIEEIKKVKTWKTSKYGIGFIPYGDFVICVNDHDEQHGWFAWTIDKMPEDIYNSKLGI